MTYEDRRHLESEIRNSLIIFSSVKPESYVYKDSGRTQKRFIFSFALQKYSVVSEKTTQALKTDYQSIRTVPMSQNSKYDFHRLNAEAPMGTSVFQTKGETVQGEIQREQLQKQFDKTLQEEFKRYSSDSEDEQ